jgi:hypothetical protein
MYGQPNHGFQQPMQPMYMAPQQSMYMAPQPPMYPPQQNQGVIILNQKKDATITGFDDTSSI